MFNLIRHWWRQRIVRNTTVPQAQWDAAFAGLPLLERLQPHERQRLRELAILFLHYKSIEMAGGLQRNTHMDLLIALQACLPVLNLGLSWYRGWVSVIVYPQGFSPVHQEVDEAGVVHELRRPLLGESWLSGPVILSWEDTQRAGAMDGQNLVIHEFAHKLDMLNGDANGFPPLHRDMSSRRWTEVFSAAFDDLRARLGDGRPTVIDPYGGESPAEFFAVLSEVFFERPRMIRDAYPEVYTCLAQFYRQDPLNAGN